MQKILKMIVCCLLFASSITSIKAEDSIEMISSVDKETKNSEVFCGNQYELSQANSDGTFGKIACYATFEEAKQNMSADDHVIRHISSYSPTKIIAAKAAIAYSYPRRSSNSTLLNIYQFENYSTRFAKTTYVVQHRELQYFETMNFDANTGNGKVHVNLQGFDGYTDLKNIDIVPIAFLNSATIYLGGNTAPGTSVEEPFKVAVNMGYYSVSENSGYKDLNYTYYSGWAKSGTPDSYTMTIGPAPAEMEVGKIYYSYDQENFYSDKNYKNFVTKYYNYYSYLPFRSQTSISAEVFDKYLAAKGYTQKPEDNDYWGLKQNQSLLVGEGVNFIAFQNKYGVNALLTFALAINESGWGRSKIAIEKNNLFGWDAVDSNPGNATDYVSATDSIEQQMAYNLRTYLDINNGVYFGSHAGNKGSGFNVKYASDPYWGMKIAQFAYSIDKFAANYSGSLVDHDKYAIAIIDEYKTPVYKSASVNSGVLYSTEYGSTYQKNHTAIVLGLEKGFGKIQSTNIVGADGNIISSKTNGTTTPKTAYDFSRSIGYVEYSKLNFITDTTSVESYDSEVIYDFTEFKYLDDNQTLSISGLAFIRGMDANKDSNIAHTLIIEDIVTGAKIKINGETSNASEPFTLYDGKNYERINFNFKFNVTDLYPSTYALSINVKNGDSSKTQTLYYSVADFVPKTIENEGYNISVVQKQSRGYRYQIEFESYDFDKALINKPTRTDTTFWIDAISFNNGVLNFSGNSWIYFTNFTSNNDVKMNIKLVDESNNVYDYPLTISDSDINYSESFGIPFDFTHTSYNAKLDLNSLEKGVYKAYLHISNDKHSDFIRLYENYRPEVDNHVYNGKTYSVQYEKGTNYISIIIE